MTDAIDRMLTDLVPELLGLVVTPAAVAGCILLLQTKRPIANSCAFGAGFMTVYVLLGVAALLGGGGAGAGSNDALRNWASAIVGGLFLVGALAIVLRRPPVVPREPRWVAMLEGCSTREAAMTGLVMAVVNPNVAILLSGFTIVMTAGADAPVQVGGVALLLAACLVDFLVPIGCYVLLGELAESMLSRAKSWMIAHNRALSIAVLLIFGVLFFGRGIAGLL